MSGLLTWQHDGAAALIKDGKLIATVEEERLNRQRHAKGLPKLAIEYCLKEGGISMEDIDIIAVGYKPAAFLTNLFFYRSLTALFNAFATIFIYNRGLRELQRKSGARIIYVPHHLAHAASAYRCGDKTKANIMVLDGAGEIETATLFEGVDGEIKRLEMIRIAQFFDTKPWRSIGLVYTRMTSFLNLGAHGEGKTMGLASYGIPRFDFSLILNIRDWNHYTIDRRNISKLYGEYERKNGNEPITQEQKDLAASLQKALEDGVVNLARDAYERTRIRDFAFAGGVTLNCNANSRVLEQDFCDSLFIQPAANDGGIALGAALEVMHQIGDGDFVKFETAYWGPSYSDDKIEEILKNSKMSYRKSDNIARDTASLVAKGKIVGWFQGKAEIGPRALGTRSILANPCIKGMNDKINVDVKHREVWRPFAPSVLADDASVYFEGVEKATESPFMLHTFYVREQYRETLPSITHIDGSSRIQTVSNVQNEPYYNLLKYMKEYTGHPIVINTSFNDNGEPIVCSPRDALRCYFSTGLDALAIGNFILEK